MKELIKKNRKEFVECFELFPALQQFVQPNPRGPRAKNSRKITTASIRRKSNEMPDYVDLPAAACEFRLLP